ncbi:MAG: helix-turn-helix domain-containing protein [Mycobacteriales bacterium]
MALTNVVAVVCDGFAAFELGVVCEVFGLDRTDQGLPRYDFAVVAAEEPPLTSGQGYRLDTDHRLDRVAAADLVCIPAWRSIDERPPEPLLCAVREAVARGARVLSVCSGAFVLAAAGLLDGRRATTHWRYAETLAARYPAIDVDPDVLYVDDGPVVTSAGTAAGIDACLHVIRQEHGVAVANAIARRMVVPPFRDGGQAQYVEAPVPLQRRAGTDELATLLDWAVTHLHEDLGVEDLARRAHMSPRTFARRFREATGTTPHRWVLAQRVGHAQQLLEQGLSVEEVARRAGFGSAATLRSAFSRERGISPAGYARTFRSAV